MATDVFIVFVEGLGDCKIPVGKCAGGEKVATMLMEGLAAEFRDAAPDLRFSYGTPTQMGEFLAIVSKLIAAGEGAFGEDAQAVYQAVERQTSFLRAKLGVGGGVGATATPVNPPAEDQGEDPGYIWFNATEAARYVGVVERTIRNRIQAGTLMQHDCQNNRYKLSFAELDAMRDVQKKKLAKKNQTSN